MKKTTAAIAFGFLVVSWSGHPWTSTDRTAHAESARFQPSQRVSGLIGGYQPVSDVDQHAKMSADVCAINNLLDAKAIDFAAIGAIYRDGKHSVEGNGTLRTFGEFAGASRSTEFLLGRYERQFGAGWLDAFASAAIGGTGAFAGEPDLVRRQGIQKAVRDQVLVAWTFHELDAAVEKAKKGDFAAQTGAPHNWDEARAYYHGEKPECAPYATAEERGREFGTESGVRGRILAAMQQGLESLRAKDPSGAVKARDEVVRNVTITYIQSAIKYSAAMNTALVTGKKDDARIFQAEGWAYFRVIEPLVAERDPMAARSVANVFDLRNAPAPGSGEKVAHALVKVYAPFKIGASEVGTYRAP